MKFFTKRADGGPESTVTGFWLMEAKKLFSAALLRFGQGSRNVYHSHAFHSLSWLAKGRLTEHRLDGSTRVYKPSLRPFVTTRDNTHRVVSDGTSWVITLRGPWQKTWWEYNPATKRYTTLTHGRLRIEETK